jgi:hypothetical protein
LPGPHLSEVLLVALALALAFAFALDLASFGLRASVPEGTSAWRSKTVTMLGDSWGGQVFDFALKMVRRLIGLGALLAPGIAGAQTPAEAWRLCVEKAHLAPVKLTGHPWDGPPLSSPMRSDQIAGMLVELAAGANPAGLVKAGFSMLNAGTVPPDVVLRLWLDDKVALTTSRQQDTYAPSWAPGPPNCVHATRAELTGLVRLEVVDVDLENDDSIGRRLLPKGLPESAFEAGVWNAGPFDAVGTLELSLVRKAAPDVTVAPRPLAGEVLLSAGTSSQVEVAVPAAPATLRMRWTVAGQSEGLAGARDDLLIGASVVAPSGRLVLKKGKHQAADESIAVREPGTWKLVFSNQGIIRSSSRKVRWQVETTNH